MSTASRRYLPIKGSLDREVILDNIVLSVDNTGAVTGSVGKDVASFTKTGVGQYKLTLNRKYPELLFANILPAATFSDVVFTLVADNLSVDGSIDFASSDFAGQKDTAQGMYIVVQLAIKFSSIVG